MARIESGPIDTQTYERKPVNAGALPNGIYKGIVVRTGQKETNGEKGKGVMVEVEFDITWPEDFSNRKFWDSFNVVNPTQKTAEIGIENLSDLAQACYHKGFVLEDDEQLMGKEVIMELYIKKGEDYPDRNNPSVMRKGVDKNKCAKYWNRNTNVEEAKKAMKTAAKQSSAAPAIQAAPAARPAAASAAASKWGAPKAAVAPSAVSTPAQQAAAPQPVQHQAPAPAAQAPLPPAQPAQAPAPAENKTSPWKRTAQAKQ